MDEFIGNVTDTTLSKNPKGTWQEAKNILLTKGFKSISNEDGFSLEYIITGKLIIGSIITNTDEVYFSVANDNTLSESGYINKRVETPTYEVILIDTNLGFRLDCPIEGIYSYNYKGELIVSWCHGIRDNAARPMIINITTPPFPITAGVLDTPADLELIYMFPHIDEGTYTLTRLDEGNLFGDIAYITYAYVYEDGNRTQFFPVSELAYITEGYLNTRRLGVNIALSNLDTKFSKLKLGIVLRDETTLKGYISYELPYDTVDTLVYDLISIESFILTDASEIVIRSDSFEKIRTITRTQDQIHVSGTEKKDLIDFQPYANQLTLAPVLERSDTVNQHSFMPDEVMAFFIELQLLDGTYTDGFHLPGKVAAGTETDDVTAGQITAFNLSWLPANTPQFKIFNTGTAGGTHPNYTSTFGYWENEELYPNESAYDSSGVGGSDLRGTPVRHHRFAGVKALHDLDPTYLPSRNGDAAEDILTANQVRFILNVKLTNFDAIVPSAIKDEIQGYRVSYAKRTFANSLVIDNCAMIKRKETVSTSDPTAPASFKCIELESTSTPEYQKSRLFSAPLFNSKPAITPTFLIGNYIYNGIKMLVDPDYTDSIPDANLYSEVDKVTYAPANNLSYGNQYTEEGIDIDLVASQDFDIPTTNPKQPGSTAINITMIQLKDNVYPGLRSTDLVVAGRIDGVTTISVLRGSDTSIKSYIDCSGYEITTPASDWSNHHRLTYIGYYSPLHTMALYNDRSLTIEITTANEPLLEGREYEFRVIENLGATYLNDLVTGRTFNTDTQFVNRFPFRINTTNKIPTEGNIMEALKTFPVDSFYDMPNDKGEIWALRGSTKILYIQQQFSLFVTTIKDTLFTKGENVFLGTSDFFETIPDEVVRDDKGYIGCTSQFACILFKAGYVTVDQIQGKIFLIYGGKEEISAKGKRNYFEENWDIGFDITDDENIIEEPVDNPYISVGHIVGYDDKNNRLIFTKKQYELKDPDLIPATITRDGQFYTLVSSGNLIDYTNATYFEDKSITWSYSLDNNVWVCKHDYKPNMIFDNSKGLFSVHTSFTGGSKIYKHNELANKGWFYDTQYPSYVDLIFNGNLEISKLYQSIMWISDNINSNGGDTYNKTITHIGIYNKSKATGLINLKDNEFLLTRTNEGQWSFNDFRDLVIDQLSPIIDDNGDFISANLNNDKLWFEKNNFISKFIVVRLYMDNVSWETTLIHSVNVTSIKSIR